MKSTAGSSPRDYWNDAVAEQGKAYAVTELGDDRLRSWIGERTNLRRGFLDGVDFLTGTLGWKGGRVLDVAAGVCWTSALLSRRPEVTEVVAVDYSRHRIEVHAPIAIRQLGGDENKIARVVDDAFKTGGDHTYDLVLFNQALYMFSQPAEILKRCRALLRRGGMVMVSGERIEVEPQLVEVAFWRGIARNLLRGKTDETGRVRMTDRDYRRALTQAGFSYRFQLLNYPVFPESSSWPAGNHFGVLPPA